MSLHLYKRGCKPVCRHSGFGVFRWVYINLQCYYCRFLVWMVRWFILWPELDSVSLKFIFLHSWQQSRHNEVGLCCVCHGGIVWVPCPVSQSYHVPLLLLWFFLLLTFHEVLRSNCSRVIFRWACVSSLCMNCAQELLWIEVHAAGSWKFQSFFLFTSDERSKRKDAWAKKKGMQMKLQGYEISCSHWWILGSLWRGVKQPGNSWRSRVCGRSTSSSTHTTPWPSSMTALLWALSPWPTTLM